MSTSIQEARDFLTSNQAIRDEMNSYDKKRNQGFEELADDEEKMLNEYHRLKTYILEKKMGLLDRE